MIIELSFRKKRFIEKVNKSNYDTQKDPIFKKLIITAYPRIIVRVPFQNFSLKEGCSSEGGRLIEESAYNETINLY